MRFKVYPLYFLDIAYQKALNYEKYLRVFPKHVPFSLYTHPSHSNTQPDNIASPLGLLLVPLPLAWLRL